jgi:Na+-transporting NADH:ubiquinone oxidoreductase subunit F
LNHPVIVNSGRKPLEIREGENLLAGLSRNGLILPTVCGGKGQCGFCRIRVEKGAGPLTQAEKERLSPPELTAGARLACQVRVTGETAITVPDYLFNARRSSAIVKEKRFLATNIIKLALEILPPSSMPFVPGQYVLLRSGIPAVTRAYSMASTPSATGTFALIIKKVPQGLCSGWISDQLREGAEVRFSGPYGDFRLSESGAPALFIAGGSGMAPMASMLLQMKEQGSARRIVFCFGAVTKQDLFYVEEMRSLEKALPGFRFIPALSGEAPESDWRGERGLIPDVAERHLKEENLTEAYLCGPPRMIAASLTMLLRNGFLEKNIFYDRFE